MQTRAQATRDPGEHLGSGQAGPVARLVHADVAPRRAVQGVGPRLDLTCSAHTGEPSDSAKSHGDRSRSSRECPTADVSVHAVAEGRRTAGVNPLAPGSRCVRRRVTCEGVPAVFVPGLA